MIASLVHNWRNGSLQFVKENNRWQSQNNWGTYQERPSTKDAERKGRIRLIKNRVKPTGQDSLPKYDLYNWCDVCLNHRSEALQVRVESVTGSAVEPTRRSVVTDPSTDDVVPIRDTSIVFSGSTWRFDRSHSCINQWTWSLWVSADKNLLDNCTLWRLHHAFQFL